MKRNAVSLFVFLIILLPAVSSADVVHLRNGDRLSGTVLRKLNGLLTMKTDYAGKVAIKWEEVERIETTRPITVLLRDDSVVEGTLFNGKEGDPPGTLALADIRQVNPPPYLSGKGMEWRGRLNTGLNVSEGNNETKQVHLDGEIGVRSRQNRFTVASVYHHARDGEAETEANFAGSGKFDHFLSRQWYASTRARYEKDRFKDLDLRSTYGLGGGYQFRESRLLNLAVEAGFNYVIEDHIIGDNDEYPAARWGFDYDQYFFGETLQLFHNHDLAIGLEDTEDILLQTKTGIRVPVWEKITATLAVNFEWDNAPSDDKGRTDTNYLMSLGYTW